MAYLYKNDVFLVDVDGKNEKRLTTDGKFKSRVALSTNRKKIAFLTTNKSPVIIDDTSKLLETLSGYQHVKSFGWCNDDQTLYMLIGNQLVFHGAPVSFPASLRMNNLPGDEMTSASISPHGDIAYAYQTQTAFEGSIIRQFQLKIRFGGGLEKVYKTDKFIDFLKWSADGSMLTFQPFYPLGSYSYIGIWKTANPSPGVKESTNQYFPATYNSDQLVAVCEQRGNGHDIIIRSSYDSKYDQVVTRVASQNTMHFDWK